MRKYGNSNKQEYIMEAKKNTHLKMVSTHFTNVTEFRNNHDMHRSSFSLASSKIAVLFDIHILKGNLLLEILQLVL